MSTFVTETFFQFKEWYVKQGVTAKILYAKQNKKESRKLYFRTAIKFTYSLASLTWKVKNDGGSFVR